MIQFKCGLFYIHNRCMMFAYIDLLCTLVQEDTAAIERWSDENFLTSRVNNKERKRVSNALYTPCNMFSASNVTCSHAHVTSPRAKQLIFPRTEKNRGVFHEFYARFFTNARFIL